MAQSEKYVHPPNCVFNGRQWLLIKLSRRSRVRRTHPQRPQKLALPMYATYAPEAYEALDMRSLDHLDEFLLDPRHGHVRMRFDIPCSGMNWFTLHDFLLDRRHGHALPTHCSGMDWFTSTVFSVSWARARPSAPRCNDLLGDACENILLWCELGHLMNFNVELVHGHVHKMFGDPLL